MSLADLKPTTDKPLRAGLWVAQALLAITFAGIGAMKLVTPVPDLAAMMKWPGEYPSAFVRFIGVVDLLGGIGVLLPALTRIQPGLSVLAALGCAMLQMLAIAFHISRGEFQGLPLNMALLALSVFVYWGRSRRVPIAPQQPKFEAAPPTDGPAG